VIRVADWSCQGPSARRKVLHVHMLQFPDPTGAAHPAVSVNLPEYGAGLRPPLRKILSAI
jgi:hypothetical protein